MAIDGSFMKFIERRKTTASYKFEELSLSCEIHKQEIAELKSIIAECRPEVLSAQFRAQDEAERTGEDQDYVVILQQLLERIDAALAN